MMYLPSKLDNNGLYFKNTISEIDILIDLIERLDADSEFENAITKWKDVDKALKVKSFLDINNLKTEKQKQNASYVKNSFLYAAIYCMSQYAYIYETKVGALKNIYLYKAKSKNSSNNFQDFNVSFTENTISSYIILNPENYGEPFYLDKKNEKYIWPEPGSLVMVSDRLSHSIGINQNKDLYFAKFKFEINPSQVRCSNLI